MSKKDIAEVNGMLTEVIENVNLEINKLITKTKYRFESIKNHMNLVQDHEDFKKCNTKSNDNNKRRLTEKQNHELKTKILQESSLKEKEQVISSIITSFTCQQQPQPVNRNRLYTQKNKQCYHKIQSNIILLVTIVLVLCLNNVNYEYFTNEDENINLPNPGNQQILKQQIATIKNTKRPPVITNNFPENKNPKWGNHKTSAKKCQIQ